MYRNCIYCSADLGANEAIEHFPVGRRLAFDPRKGRLWVVCSACRRWNLTPLDERWEAIEEAERAFRDTRLRVSTDNVGLARVREGLELVRVGAPARTEFAAWRYGAQLGARRRSALYQGVAGAAVAGALVAGGIGAGLAAGAPLFLVWMSHGWVSRSLAMRKVARLRVDGKLVPVRRFGLEQAQFRHQAGSNLPVLEVKADEMLLRYEGEQAARTAGLLLPKVNAFGASDAQVRDAVREIEKVGDPERYFLDAARVATRAGMTTLARFPIEARLALEMAAHEEAERRALEGELADLERAWADAEEIAAIADDMLLPASVGAALDRLKRRT